MRPDKASFRHESLQDRKTIQDLLKALSKGIGKGRLSFSDDNGEVVLEPDGLLKLKVTASQDEQHQRLDIRVSWQDEEALPSRSPLTVRSD